MLLLRIFELLLLIIAIWAVFDVLLPYLLGWPTCEAIKLLFKRKKKDGAKLDDASGKKVKSNVAD